MLVITVATASASTALAAEDAEAPADPVRLSLSLYIVDEAGGSASSELSSQRDIESMGQVLASMQEIWDQAGVEFVVGSITRIEAPADALVDLSQGDSTAFLDSVYDGTIEVPDPGAVNGFYVRDLGRVNGFAAVGTRVFFVTDVPSVHDERVSSHEIGHILGLHHEIADSGRLMFSGTNGMELADDEIATARYIAQGIADGLR